MGHKAAAMTDLLRSRTARALTIASVLVVSAAAHARDVRMHGPNGESGSCPEAAAMEDAEAPAPLAAPKRAVVRDKAKATPMVRSGGENTARPRWHSILPGMFR